MTVPYRRSTKIVATLGPASSSAERMLALADRNLYTAKHYASFDALVERELNIGKLAAAKLARIAAVLRPEAALELGLERALEVVTFIDGK